jgi:hypothetical protein
MSQINREQERGRAVGLIEIHVGNGHVGNGNAVIVLSKKTVQSDVGSHAKQNCVKI